jgi:hypothetical protein
MGSGWQMGSVSVLNNEDEVMPLEEMDGVGKWARGFSWVGKWIVGCKAEGRSGAWAQRLLGGS